MFGTHISHILINQRYTYFESY